MAAVPINMKKDNRNLYIKVPMSEEEICSYEFLFSQLHRDFRAYCNSHNGSILYGLFSDALPSFFKRWKSEILWPKGHNYTEEKKNKTQMTPM